jgi:hypothetical protein
MSKILGMQIASVALARQTVWTNTDTVELVWTGVVCTDDEKYFYSTILGSAPSVIRGARALYRGFS